MITTNNRGIIVSGAAEFGHQFVDDDYSLVKLRDKVIIGSIGGLQGEMYTQGFKRLGGNEKIGNILGITTGESWNIHMGNKLPTYE